MLLNITVSVYDGSDNPVPAEDTLSFVGVVFLDTVFPGQMATQLFWSKDDQYALHACLLFCLLFLYVLDYSILTG